jgi:hypothetical protein
MRVRPDPPIRQCAGPGGEHKDYQSDAGPPALRSDAARCDPRYTDFESTTHALTAWGAGLTASGRGFMDRLSRSSDGSSRTGGRCFGNPSAPNALAAGVPTRAMLRCSPESSGTIWSPRSEPRLCEAAAEMGLDPYDPVDLTDEIAAMLDAPFAELDSRAPRGVSAVADADTGVGPRKRTQNGTFSRPRPEEYRDASGQHAASALPAERVCLW